jgi:Protein of unknown function (DUF2442)
MRKVHHRMTSAEFETEAVRPFSAKSDDTHVSVTLADGRQISAPLWWYPFLEKATAKDRALIELEFSGIWWPALDEGVSVKALLLGWKAPGATLPSRAA